MSSTVPSDVLINPPRPPEEAGGINYVLPDTNLQGDRVAAQEKLSNFARFAIPSAIAGVVDSLTSGVGLTSSDSVQNFFNDYISAEAGQFYAQNREAAVGVGTLATLPLAGLAATKLVQGGGALYKLVGAESSPVLRGMFTSGMAWGDVAASVRAADMVMATNGTLDFSRGITAMLRNPASRDVLGKVALDSVKNTVAFETGVFAIHHGNQLVYPDDQTMAQYFAINGGFAIGALGVDLLITRKIMANALQSVAREAHTALDVAETKGIKDLVISRPNERGVDITVKALDVVSARAAKEDPRIAAAVVDTQSSLRDNLNALQVQQETRLVGSLQEAGQDAYKLGGITIINSGDAPKPIAMTLFRHLTDKQGSVDALAGMRGYQAIPIDEQGMRDILRRPQRAAEALKAENEILTGEFIAGFGTGREEKAIAALTKNGEQIKEAEAVQMFVYQPTGNVVNAEHWIKLPFDNPNSYTIGRVNKKELVGYSLESNDRSVFAKRTEFTVGDDMNHTIMSGKEKLKLEDLTTQQVTELQYLYDNAINKYVPGKTKITYDINQDSWLKKDAVNELLARNPSAIEDMITPDNFPLQSTSLFNIGKGDLEYISLIDKYRGLVRDIEKRNNILTGPVNVRKQIGPVEELAYKYNLPLGANGDNSNIFQAMTDLYNSTGIRELGRVAGNMDELRSLLRENQNFNSLVPKSQQPVITRGNMMNLWRDSAGNVMPSVLVASKPVPYESLSRKWLTEQAELQRDNILGTMSRASERGATLVQAVHDGAAPGSGTFRTAQQTDTLVEGIQTGGGIFGAQRRTLDVNPAYQAADGVDLLVTRRAEQEVENIFNRHNAPIAKILSNGTEADRYQFGRFAQTQSAGWQFRRELPSQLPNTANLADNAPKLGFVIDETSELTQKIWKTYFPNRSIDEAMEEYGGRLWAPDMTAAQRGEYVPLAINKIAADAAGAFHDLSVEVLANKNTIRELAGKGPLNERAYHMPPPDFVSPNTLFVLYPDGRATIATGRTPAEANVAANKLRDAYSKPEQVNILNKEALRQRSETMDDVFWRMVDPSDPLVASGTNRGGFFMPRVPTGDGFIRQALDGINEELQSTIYRSRALLFEPQIKYADLMHGVSGFVDPSKKSVFETYTAKLTGSSAFSPTSPIARGYKAIESGYDAMANKLFGMFVNQETGHAWSGELVAQVRNMEKQTWHNQMYKELETSGYNPFGSVVDMMQSEHKVVPPKSLASHAAKFNNAMSLLMLRFMDTGNALINMTSLGANLPSVTRALKKIPGENNEQWATRIGWFGSPLTDEVAFMNPARLMTSVVHDMFTPAGHADLKLLKDSNQISSITHEMMRTKFDPAGVIEKGNFNKFMRAATYAVDKSEELARTISMMAGLRLARTIDSAANPADMVAFAGRFANDIIADYRPHNRPQIFSGSVGMPLGLFQTYAWNYFERLFGYISDRNLRGLAVQSSMQTALFGAESLPGFKQFQQLMTDNLNANSNPVDNLRKRYGELPADFILYGSISNLPRLFGTGDGISLFTRADSNFRGVPSIVTPTQSASYSLLESLGKTVSAEVDQFRTGGQWSLQQTMEAVGTYFPNRYVKRMAEVWSGYSVDERGQVISSDVRNFMSIASRQMGLRTLKEQREIEGYMRTRSVAQSQMAIRDRASDSLRAMFRGGDLDTDKVMNVVRDYVKQGGDPRYVGRFFQNQVLASLVERDNRAFAEALRGGKWDAAMRLFSASKDD